MAFAMAADGAVAELAMMADAAGAVPRRHRRSVASDVHKNGAGGDEQVGAAAESERAPHDDEEKRRGSGDGLLRLQRAVTTDGDGIASIPRGQGSRTIQEDVVVTADVLASSPRDATKVAVGEGTADVPYRPAVLIQLLRPPSSMVGDNVTLVATVRVRDRDLVGTVATVSFRIKNRCHSVRGTNELLSKACTIRAALPPPRSAEDGRSSAAAASFAAFCNVSVVVSSHRTTTPASSYRILPRQCMLVGASAMLSTGEKHVGANQQLQFHRNSVAVHTTIAGLLKQGETETLRMAPPPSANDAAVPISHPPDHVRLVVSVTSTLTTVLAALDGILREPHGCFEQSSAAVYPNIMVLRFAKVMSAATPHEHGVAVPSKATRVLDDAQRKARQMMGNGYAKLVAFECAHHGFEWFGMGDGHEALTAYGLLLFVDMDGVSTSPGSVVSSEMLARTVRWLSGRQASASDGSRAPTYLRSSRSLDEFGAADGDVTDAYIAWALAEATYSVERHKAAATEANSGGGGGVFQWAANLLTGGGTSSHAFDVAQWHCDRALRTTASDGNATGGASVYVQALCANVLLLQSTAGAGSSAASAQRSMRALVRRQSRTGAFGLGPAHASEHSITRSRGTAYAVECTALAVMGCIRAAQGADRSTTAAASDFIAAAAAGISWITGQMSGGRFGTTQGTILALRAMAMYVEYFVAMSSSASNASLDDDDGNAVVHVTGVTAEFTTTTTTFDRETLQGQITPKECPSADASHPVTIRAGRGLRPTDLVTYEAKLTSLYFDRIPPHLLVHGNNGSIRAATTLGMSVSLEVGAAPPTTTSTDGSSSRSGVVVDDDGVVTPHQSMLLGTAAAMRVVVRPLIPDAAKGMVVAQVGIPAGLEVRFAQLRELRESGRIAHFETDDSRGMRVVLYWRSIGPDGVSVPIEVTAKYPGTYVSPFGRAFEYYGGGGAAGDAHVMSPTVVVREA